MALFCTRCGTPAAPKAAFCESCGAPIGRKATPVAEPSLDDSNAPPERPLRPAIPRKVWLGAAGLAGLLAVSGLTAFLLLRPLEPTSERLMAAAKAGAHGERLTLNAKRTLCLNNIDYSTRPIYVSRSNERTLQWIDTLSKAGLYQAGAEVNSGGYFPQTLMQYKPTAELNHWLDGSRLCVARSVELAEVSGIGEPTNLQLGASGRAQSMRVVKAQLVFKAREVAPWLEQDGVKHAVLAQLSGWTHESGTLRMSLDEVFGLNEGAWIAAPALQPRLAQAWRGNGPHEADAKAEGMGVSDSVKRWGRGIRNWFSFGGHPLKGSWRMDNSGIGSFVPPGIDARLVFTNSTMESGGRTLDCEFEVDGKRVTVRQKGQSRGMVFVLEDENTASLDIGLMTLRYQRVD